jgi:hypothetical protein
VYVKTTKTGANPVAMVAEPVLVAARK